jgi:hypothetical protein
MFSCSLKSTFSAMSSLQKIKVSGDQRRGNEKEYLVYHQFEILMERNYFWERQKKKVKKEN